MTGFKMVTDQAPAGDQPKAIAQLVEGTRRGDRYQTLLGVTGSGKSIVASTPVLLKQGPRIWKECIGSFVDRWMAQAPSAVRRQGDTELLEQTNTDEPIEALSFDPRTGEVSWKRVRQLLRHRSPKTLWRLVTTCGRAVTVTGDHNFFVLRNGHLHLVRTEEIRRSDYLPLPRKLPEPANPLFHLPLSEMFNDRDSVFAHMPSFPRVWPEGGATIRSLLSDGKVYRLLRGERTSLSGHHEAIAVLPAPAVDARFGTRLRHHDVPGSHVLSDGLLRFIGYYIGEGHAAKQSVIISSGDRQVIADVVETVTALGLRYSVRGRYGYRIHSVLWSRLLAAWCGQNAQSKRLPPFWPQLSNAHLAQLLRAYFTADGDRDGSTVSCTTASRELASDVCFALLRFGIVARTRERRIKVPNRNERWSYWTITVSGQPFLRAFRDAIGFATNAKLAWLNTLVRRAGSTNVDVVPLSGDDLRWLRGRLGLSQRVVASCLDCSRPLVSMIEHGRRHPSSGLAGRLIALLREETARQGCDEARDVIEAMGALPGLFWTPVSVVGRMAGEASVYDLAVDGNETFFAGEGGLFVHNTYTMARVIEQVNRPILVLAHNKTLAAQLYGEFRQYFPDNAVRYFVSYYDYYQPEAYVPQTDLYIAKDASINDEIDRLRHASTKALMERRDVIVVASVSCIYGLGSPQDYQDVMLFVRRGETRSRGEILRRLVDIQYERNDIDFARGRFRVRGDVIEIFPAYEDRAVRIELFGDEVEHIHEVAPLTGEVLADKPAVAIWPAKHWVTTASRLEEALGRIEAELRERVQWFKDQGKLLEAQRLEFRTKYDLEMLREVGYCPGIENYSRHLSGRAAGERPGCLLDYFPKDFLVFIDESHVTVPQVHGMHEGDRARKKNLVDFGFRLPSAYDNRPLTFDEFDALVPQVIFVSATPGQYELRVSRQVAEQIVRPTGLVDPLVEVRPAKGQVDDLIAEIKAQAEKGERALVTTLTKRMAEDLSDYLQELGMKVHYLHSEVETLQRVEILKDLRQGTYDVLVGINLLREGLDLPEVSLVAILDADKEGYLRSDTSLIQTMGRAARNAGGRVLLYADAVTESMRRAIDETNRRRAIQLRYNEEHGITPETIVKPIRDFIEIEAAAEESAEYVTSPSRGGSDGTEGAVLTAKELIGLAEQGKRVPWDIARLLMLSPAELEGTIEALEREMRKAAAELQFEKAAALRDQLQELRKGLGEPFFAGRPPRRGSRRGGPAHAGARSRPRRSPRGGFR
jgi:excinuclease ABC B subunit